METIKHPISFSIPSEKIVTCIPVKNNFLSNYIPVGVGESTYVYDNEIDYYNGYKNSLFAVTKKKGGWDCMRHYEILACGCIPYFENLEACPKNILYTFPKELIITTNKFCDYLKNKYKISSNNNNIDQLSKEDLDKCYDYIELLLQYTRNNLTTTNIAQHIINQTNTSLEDNILYICNPPDGDYLRCLTLHGLKKLFGKKCEEYPFLPHIYKNCEEQHNIDCRRLHGRGFTYTRLLDENEYYKTNSKDEIINNIKNHKYKLIIYSSLHNEKPNHDHIFIDIVNEYYPSYNVVFMCGEDDHLPHYLTKTCLANRYCSLGYKCFVRELRD
jgi:hypothetical protein